MLRFALILLAALPLCGGPKSVAQIPLPADLSGMLGATEYRIRVPQNWNGTLLVFAHGSGSASVEVAPTPSVEAQLLARGYALAGSFYRNVADGPERTLALTNFFKGTVGHPNRTLLWGISMGGTVTLDLIEHHRTLYDGAIAIAPATAGARDTDYSLRFDVAYAAAFGWPSDKWGPLEDLRDDLYTDPPTLIMPFFRWYNGANFGQWEFIRLIMKLPVEAWWLRFSDYGMGLPGYAWAGWKGIAARSAVENRCGGPAAQNIGVVYTLTTDEIAYLGTLGVDAGQLLAWMNAHTNIAARTSARVHAENTTRLSGNLRRPLITMHGIYDSVITVSQESIYRALVEAAGAGEMLLQTYVTQPGHNPFTADQFLATLTAMEYWLDTGARPDASFFPPAKGFDPSFVPPAWPYE